MSALTGMEPFPIARAMQLYKEEGLSLRAVASRIRRCHVSVAEHLRANGVEIRPPGRKRQSDYVTEPKPEPLPKRPCLRCGRPFEPKHPRNHRLCQPCDSYAASASPLAI